MDNAHAQRHTRQVDTGSPGGDLDTSRRHNDSNKSHQQQYALYYYYYCYVSCRTAAAAAAVRVKVVTARRYDVIIMYRQVTTRQSFRVAYLPISCTGCTDVGRLRTVFLRDLCCGRTSFAPDDRPADWRGVRHTPHEDYSDADVTAPAVVLGDR